MQAQTALVSPPGAAPAAARTLLRIAGLRVAYGGIQAVKGVSFEVKEGELVSLIGANGAGKTTTLKAITGTQAAAAGEIEYMGRSIRGQGPWELVAQGLVMVPEGRGVFARMTITENLQMGAFVRNDVKLVMGLCDRVTVLDYGKQIAEGTAAEVQKNEKVIEAYLGAGDKKH